MPLLNAGRDFIAAAIIGEAVTPFNNSNARIAVGDGVTAFSASQTDLTGTNKTRVAVDAGYPQRSGNLLTFRATFGTGVANHAWNEWGIANAASSGVLLNRKLDDLGEKNSAHAWTFEVDVEIENADAS